MTASASPGTVSVSLSNWDGSGGSLSQAYRFLSPATVTVYPSPSPTPSAVPTYSVTPETFATTTSSFLLQNSGEMTAGSLTATGLDIPFTFQGGTYPGTTGTCSTSLVSGSTCLIGTEFSATLVATYADSLLVTYDDSGGSTTNSTISQALSGTGVGSVQLGMGTSHTCVVFSNGKLKCWGDGESGQLGMGDTLDRSYPTTSPYFVSGVSQVVGNGTTTCARLTTGKVNCWGGGINATHLGDNVTRTSHPSPVEVSGISTASNLCLGPSYACAVLSSGVIQC